MPADYPILGSKAALTAPKSNFRFTTKSGLNSEIAPRPKSANSRHRACAGMTKEAAD
jgi:hypothetical protein